MAMVGFTGLWKADEGKSYIASGRCGFNCMMYIFPNKKKEPGDKYPDYNVVFASIENRDEDPAPSDSDDDVRF
jgi:hypothetical protein